jgi:hypothetical protein
VSPHSTTSSTAPATEARRHAARVAAVTNIAGCLRKHGVYVPTQNPVAGFSTNGIDTTSAQFKSAYPGCLRTAMGVYRTKLLR